MQSISTIGLDIAKSVFPAGAGAYGALDASGLCEVKRQKSDTTDAEAICEAVTRPNMRFVPTKTVEQQSCLMLHRARHLFIRQQTAVIVTGT
jgi:transposase